MAGAAVLATALSLLAAPSTAAPVQTKPKPPAPVKKVTQDQVDAAAGSRNAVATRVGELSGQIAQTEQQLQQLQGRQEQAEQLVAYRNAQFIDAQQAAAAATKRVGAAQRGVAAAHARFVQYLQATYMTGDVKGTTGSLLTADDPSALLERGTLEQYQADVKINAVGQLQAATVARSNADGAARRAVLRQAHAKDAALAAKHAADAAYADEQTQKAILQQNKAVQETQLQAAQATLLRTTTDRAAYVRYQAAFAAYQQELAREAAAAAAARAAAIRQAKIAADNARRATELAAEAAKRQQSGRSTHSSGGSSGGTSGGNSSGGHTSTGGGSSIPSGPSAPTGGGWTAAKGARAVSRAMSTLGTPYAWAGGGVSGPSRGVCDGGNGAPNDCYVIGFDCSGLALYSWGQHWAHYALRQFSEAGSYHPSAGDLRPGDLIFWSFNGRVSGIHHVAIYKGGGQIIEAPYSGGYVQVSSLYAYGNFFGATRPLT